MKRLLLTLAPLLLACGLVFAVQSVRSPFIVINLNGEVILDQDIIEVDRGDFLKLTVTFEGGRRDFVKFPDTYADIPKSAKIISRNQNHLIYQIGSEKFEWKLLSQNLTVDTDEKIKISNKKTRTNEHQVYLNIPSRNVDKPYIKLSIKSSWQYTEGNLVMEEEDKSEAIIHFKIKGKTDEWFASQNLRVVGNEDTRLEEKLERIQDCYNRIEEKMIKRDFNSAQVEIRNLKTAVQQTDLVIKQIKNEDPTFFAEVTFIGLPSDKPINDIKKLRELNNYWIELNPMLELHQNNFDRIPKEPSDVNKNEILRIAKAFDNWYHSLPQNGIDLLSLYIPEINWNEKISIHNYLSFNPEEDKIKNIARGYQDLDYYLRERFADVPYENQKIMNTINRLQAVKLFDGMLRGYISSINFSSWENTREIL